MPGYFNTAINNSVGLHKHAQVTLVMLIGLVVVLD